MTKPLIQIHDVETNEVIEREMTDKELKDYQDLQTIYEAEAKAQEAIKVAKEIAEAKLAALGLTAEDLKALGL